MGMNPILRLFAAQQLKAALRPKPPQPQGKPLGEVIQGFFGRPAQPVPGVAAKPASRQPALRLLPRDPRARQPGGSLAAWYTQLPAPGLVSEWHSLRQVRSELVARLRRGALTAENRQFRAAYQKANAAFVAALQRRGLRFQDLVALERQLAARRSAQQSAPQRKVA